MILISTEVLREIRRDIADNLGKRGRGDHSAQRLLLERDRMAAATHDAEMKWKRKTIIGMETLVKYAGKHPKAQAALDELARQVRHPFDPSESDRIKANCQWRRQLWQIAVHG